MRCVVTGGAGFLGRRLVSRLSGQGFDVLSVDVQPQSSLAPGATSRVDDLKNPGALVQSLGAGTDACLIHLAWDLRREPGKFGGQAEHVALLAGLLDAWSGKGLRKAILMGSAEEYGRRAGRLKENDAPVEPLTPYGWAKRAACDLARHKCAASAVDLLWLRPFIVYGPGQKGDMAIPYAVSKAMARETADFTDGLQQRDFVYVDDVVDAIVAGVRREVRGCSAINIGTGEAVRLRDVLEAIAAELGTQNMFRFGVRDRRPGEPDVQVADPGEALRLLGWSAQTTWRDGVKKLCHESISG